MREYHIVPTDDPDLFILNYAGPGYEPGQVIDHMLPVDSTHPLYKRVSDLIASGIYTIQFDPRTER